MNEEAKPRADEAPSPAPPRLHLVKTAAEFLNSPSVQDSSMELKVAFLRRKGLTDEEVSLATRRADATLLATKDGATRVATLGTGGPSRWTMCRDVANTAVLLAGICYGAVWAYQKVIVPYLFGKGSDDEEKEVVGGGAAGGPAAGLAADLAKLREDLERAADRRSQQASREVADLKADVSSLRKLLLNRKQFPGAGSAQGVLSIPSWQMSGGSGDSDEHQPTAPTPPQDDEGNNSNGSESSLEMIKE